MTLGSDVSGMTTTAANAAAKGLSIVVPLYNEAAGLAALHQRICELAKTLRQRYRLGCEIVYVDDGSADATLAIAHSLPADAVDVQVVSLSRNFGKEAALMAGLDHARLGAVLFMDGDGQHPPALVEQLVRHWIEDGYDVVYTAKAHRDNEPFLRRLAGRGFYALINWGARQKIPEDAGDFRLLSPRAVAALRQLPERNRFFKGLASWIGFRQIRVDYEPAPRTHGVTTFSAAHLLGLSIEGVTSFSVAPLRFASLLGVILAGGAFLFGISILWEVLTTGKQVPGYPSLVIGLMTIGGVQLIMIGIVGEYIGKILSELKARPIYFVAEHRPKAFRDRQGRRRLEEDGGRMSAAASPRRIWLCADDYGISPGVNRAIRDLIERGRLNATSVMMVGPAIERSEIEALQAAAKASPRCAIGLHVTLSAPFRPLTMHFRPLDGDMFLPFPKLLRAGLARRLDREFFRNEVKAQLAAFAKAFGRAPDFVDGHQHVQLYPQVRDGFVDAVAEAVPKAWVRQGGRDLPLKQRLASPKAMVLDILSAQFRRRAGSAGLSFNPGFAGAYDFTQAADFGALMRQFLEGLPDGGLIMCHPGFVDEVLTGLDPMTDVREREHGYLASEAFARLLTDSGVTLG
ncbi:putative glycoside hydrolase/deacetylase ChbG (UPF0249 family)/glycosyltransferase involved in cell wall biosynthesis [Bradyrhizobium sp. LM6.9]